MLFSGGVQVLFDTVHGIHGILEGADEQIDFARVGDRVACREDAGMADRAVGTAFDKIVFVERELHYIPKSNRLFAGEAVVDDHCVGNYCPMLTADREGNGFDFALAIRMEGANLRFQKQCAAVVAEAFYAVFMGTQFITAVSQCHAVCDGQQFVRLLDCCVSAP